MALLFRSCNMSYFLEFDAFDNPMQLSKVGNWVITFLSPKEELENIQLAITYVLPRQANGELQPRRIMICKTSLENTWRIETIECFNSAQNTEVNFSPASQEAQQILQSVQNEFERYDVCVRLKQTS